MGRRIGSIFAPPSDHTLPLRLLPSVLDLALWHTIGGFAWLEDASGVGAFARACGLDAVAIVGPSPAVRVPGDSIR
jgi:hypothetical protein